MVFSKLHKNENLTKDIIFVFKHNFNIRLLVRKWICLFSPYYFAVIFFFRIILSFCLLLISFENFYQFQIIFFLVLIFQNESVCKPKKAYTEYRQIPTR